MTECFKLLFYRKHLKYNTKLTIISPSEKSKCKTKSYKLLYNSINFCRCNIKLKNLVDVMKWNNLLFNSDSLIMLKTFLQ